MMDIEYKITKAEHALRPLPAGQITVQGRIKKHIEEDAGNGWVSVADKMSRAGIMCWDPNCQRSVPYYTPKCFSGAWDISAPYYQPLIDRMGVFGEGEFQAHWMDAVFRMGFVADIKECRELSRRCVDDILSSLDETGYLGVDLPQVRFTGNYVAPFGLPNGMFELSGMGEILGALLLYHRFTKDERVLTACTKAADLICERTTGKPVADLIHGGPLMTNPLVTLYRLTGEQKYLTKATVILQEAFRFICSYDKNPFAQDTLGLKGCHSATVGMTLISMIDLYRATGDTGLLDLAKNMNEQILAHAMQPHGAPTGHGEYLDHPGPGVNTELCDTFWWCWAWIEMAKLSGESRYGDLAEKAFLNALPASRSADGRAAAYFTRPNQLFAIRQKGQRSLYAARLFVECCQANAPRLMPIVAEHMVMARPDGYAVLFYGPCSVEHTSEKSGKVTITQDTEYPFSEAVHITLGIERGKATFPLLLRVPGWCKSAEIRINDTRVDVATTAGDWACLERTWEDSDKIDLLLPMDVQVIFDENDIAYVECGPLLFCLPVDGDQRPCDEWGSFEEYPASGAKWNYALCLNRRDPASSFTLKKQTVDKDACAWEQSSYVLEVDAVSLPDMEFDTSAVQPETATDVPEPALPTRPFKVGSRREKVGLVPIGFTNLRMTYLPVVYSTTATS